MQCPSCHKEVSVKDKDVGALFTCPQCRSVYFINFDGTPEFGEIIQPTAEELLQMQNLPEKKKSKKQDQNENQNEIEPEQQEVEGLATEFSLEPLPIEALPAESSTIETSEVVPQDFNNVASEIADFGNQQVAMAGLTYDLEITGLDNKEAQTLLKEAINDSRFGWHVDDIVREIKKGQCVFKGLTPVQAFVLARRIQFMDVEMKWTQNVIA